MQDKILQFLQEKMVGQLRYKKPHLISTKKKYMRDPKNWPVVMIVKVERHHKTIYPNIPQQRMRVSGFKVHYLYGKKVHTISFTESKWVLKHFTKTQNKDLLRC